MNAQNNPQSTQFTPKPQKFQKPSVGSLFAGIDGFDLGFEWAGFHTSWQAGVGSSAININCADIIAVPNGRGQMAVRERTTVNDGLCKGLDETNATEARAAGNAVCPQVAQWIAT